MSELSLGIDLGTTSVKIVLVDCSQDTVVFESSLESKAKLHLEDSFKDEQSVPQIFFTVNKVLDQVPVELMSNVKYLGFSGQMHGVVLWNNSQAWNWNDDDNTLTLNEKEVSNLVTWQDTRCTPEFLASLPSADSHLGVHTGFGIPTVFWLQRNQPDGLQGFNCGGIIQDFLVAALTNRGKMNLEERPLMSPQNAASWGYFNTSEGDWNREILRSHDFPVGLLPEIREAGSLAGTLHRRWHGIPSGCKIGVPLGDLQASIYSTLYDKPKDTSAFLNISTSAQLAIILPTNFQPHEFYSNSDNSRKYKGIAFFPYFQGRYLAVAAALNGGNCLATFVNVLGGWIQEMGLEIDQSTLWSKVLTLGSLQKTTDLQVQPTLLGERSEPNKKGALENIHPGNLTLGHFTRAICKGIISNMEALMPQEFLKQYGIETIYGTGSALQRNSIFQEEMTNIFSEVSFQVCEGGDSALGAAALGKRVM